MTPLPNRLAVYLTAAISLLVGVTPLIADLDWESTAGLMASLVPILTVVAVWLNNWGKWEARGDQPVVAVVDEEPPDDFDEATAEPIPATAVEAANIPDAPAEGSTLQSPPPLPPPPGPGGTTGPPEAR